MLIFHRIDSILIIGFKAISLRVVSRQIHTAKVFSRSEMIAYGKLRYPREMNNTSPIYSNSNQGINIIDFSISENCFRLS